MRSRPSCCGQVKTDTTLSCLDDFFVRIGTDIPERRMCAPTVVKHLDIIDEVSTRCLTRPLIPLRGARTLHAAEKPLRDRLVQAIPRVPHAAHNPPIRQQCPGDLTGRLRAPGTLVHQARLWLATTQRPLQGTANPWRLQRLAHRPAHHLARIPVQPPRGIPPAFLGPEVWHIAAPRPMGCRDITGARQKIRRSPLPLTPLGGLWPPTTAARTRAPGLWPETACCDATPFLPLILELRAHATTAIPVGRLCCYRRAPLQQSHLCTTEGGRRRPPVVGITPTAPTLPHVTPHHDRPARLRLSNTGVCQRDS